MLESYIFRAPGQHGRVRFGGPSRVRLAQSSVSEASRHQVRRTWPARGCEEETLSHNWIWLPASSNLATRRGEGQLLHEAGHAVYSMCDNVQQLHMNIEGQ